MAASSPSVYAFTPTTIRRPDSISRCSSNDASAISRWGKPALDRLDHPAELVDPLEVLVAELLHPVGQRLDEVGAAERVDRVHHAGLVGDDLLRAQRDPDRRPPSGAQAPRRSCSCAATGSRPSTPASASIAVRTMLLSGCCAVSDTPGGLRVEAHPPRLRLFGPERVPELARPDPPRRPVLRDLLEEVDLRVEEERQARGEVVDVDAASDRVLDVRQAVFQSEGQLLCRRRSRLTDVVAADAHRMPARHPLRAPLDHVGHQPHRGVDREAPFLLRDVLLEDVGLDRPPEPLGGQALALRRDHIERQHDRRRRVDRHRNGHLVERNPAEQRLHVRGPCRSRLPHARPRPASAGDRSRAPSATACRTPSKAPSARARAGSGTARWSPRRSRSRRTGASSTAGPGTSTGTRRV